MHNPASTTSLCGSGTLRRDMPVEDFENDGQSVVNYKARSAALRTLIERGYVEQCSDIAALDRALCEKPVTFYVGIDPTAPSLHAGHLVPVMACRLLQRHGHRPILVVGGGTAMIGDPSGKTESRKLLTQATVDANRTAIRAQFGRFLRLEGEQGVSTLAALPPALASADHSNTPSAKLIDNSDWLAGIGYLDFLRDIGRHFTINRMIASKTYRDRLDAELPLSFLEFNYQLLQAYDFLHLHRELDCTLQIGGSEQWGNIVAGVELIRRVGATQLVDDSAPPARAECFGLTFKLLTTAEGKKMGKTERGALWLDPEQTSPFEYYQYWINCDDRDVAKLLRLFSELELEEIESLVRDGGAALRVAKARLAFEATRVAHGEDAAIKARVASEQAFGNSDDWSEVPCEDLAVDEIALLDLLVHPAVGAFKSKREARARVDDGAVRLNGEPCKDAAHKILASHQDAQGIRIQVGKRNRFRVRLAVASAN